MAVQVTLASRHPGTAGIEVQSLEQLRECSSHLNSSVFRFGGFAQGQLTEGALAAQDWSRGL